MPRQRADGSTRPKGGKPGDLAAEIAEAAEWLESFAATMVDQRHPDHIGVYRQPEPKSIYSPAGFSHIGSIARPKSGNGKPTVLQPYSKSRLGQGRWRSRG